MDSFATRLAVYTETATQRGEMKIPGLIIAILLIAALSAPAYAQDNGEGEEDERGCCICASAYASTDEGYLDTIREFRNEFLMTSPVGQGVVEVYYRLSPPVARFLDENPVFKPAARVALMPVVLLSQAAVETSRPEKLAMLGGAALALGALLVAGRMRSRGKART